MYMLEATAAATTGSMIVSMLPFLLIIVVMYFMIIRPQKKKDKEMQEMRSSIEIGDTVTTIGGIVGIVVSMKEDTIVIETGTNNTKIRFKRYAVSEVTKLKVD